MTRYVVQAGWDDVPHLSAEAQAELARSYPPHERDARMRGIPQLGSGAIYPVPESELIAEPMLPPNHWRHVYALDVGWNRTAALWCALDPASGVLYCYSEHYRGNAEPPLHAEAIKARGTWIPGVIDPAARGRSQADGQSLMSHYQRLGLKLIAADNRVEAGLYEVWERLSTGRIRVARNLENFWGEYRLYRRDDKGRVVKERDHLMDCLRYAVMSGLAIAIPKPTALTTRPKFEAEYDPFAAMNQRLRAVR